MNWYISVLKKYAVFSGRARRQEFWMFWLFNLLISVAIIILERLIAPGRLGAGVISSIYSLAVLIPYLAVTVRRFHDTGRSAWLLLLPLVSAVFAAIAIGVTIATVTGLMPDGVPSGVVIAVFALLALIPGIAIFIFLVQDSQAGENQYGKNPKEQPEETQAASPDSNV